MTTTDSSMDTDEKFYNRSDAHIQLANDQLKEAAPGKVSASMMFAAARFNAWMCAKDFDSGAAMADKCDDILDYFTAQYHAMLKENLDNYIAHFDSYVKPGVKS